MKPQDMADSADTPLAQYEADISEQGFHADEAQRSVVMKLQALHQRLTQSQSVRWWKWRRREAVAGLYIWGSVGRGKTYLMDIFYETLPIREKKRLHFHRFMHYVHEQLRARQGEKNPLHAIARDFSRQARVLCFDEFFVSDIGDAMILATLLETLFREGVTLVATSNRVPDGLYEDGLQRDRFLPAIALIKSHTEVINLDGDTDYRLRLLEQAALYHFPLDTDAETFLQDRFASLSAEHGHCLENSFLLVEKRSIPVRKLCENTVWFEFTDLCGGPRSTTDYIEIAKEYHTVMLSGVRAMDGASDDLARRFINMVDEFYDRGVKLIMTAEVPIAELYADGRLGFEFERTRSRLLEMQSRDYLALPHQA